MTALNGTCFKVLKMIVTLQERHHLNQSGIPILNNFILEIMSSFAVELEVGFANFCSMKFLINNLTVLQDEYNKLKGCYEEEVDLRELSTQIIVNHPIHQINSEYSVIQHLKKYCGYIAPREIVLGEDYGEVSKFGEEDITQKDVKELIIPFDESLCQVFRNKELRKLLESPFEPTGNGKISSARDGLKWQGDDFFLRFPNALMIQMYFDDVELVNPLGSRTGVHKVTNFYWSLLNIPEHLRSSLKSIGLIACVKSNNIKKFGYSKVLEDFVDCMNKLSSEEGLTLTLSETENICVRGALFCLNGDGLALNHIGGFKGISGARHPCRNCSLSNVEIKQCFVEKCLRNLPSHLAQLEQIADPHLNVGERKDLEIKYGVIGASVLNKVNNFDVTKQLLQDKMHNLLEGVADVCIRELISFMVVDGNSDLNLDILNSKLQSFPYPEELVKNKPTSITINHLKAHLRQKASQMMCLLTILPIILAPFENDLNRDNLLNLSLLVQISHRLLAFEVNVSSINTLKFMILTHHTRFRALYPNSSIIPKFHFLVHAPAAIQNFGPCRVSWCMRYEGLNAWFSQAAGQTNNFINITKTLTQRFQVKRCLEFGMGDNSHIVLGDKIFSPEITSRINLNSYAMGSQVANCLNVELNSTVNAASSIFLKNFEVKQNTVLIFSDNRDDLPVFCQVKAIFVKDDACAALLINILETVQFDYLRCAFEVQKTDLYTCVRNDYFLSLQPFPLVQTSFGDFVLPLYYDVRVFQG